MFFPRPTHWDIYDATGVYVATVRNADPAAARIPRTPVAPLGGSVMPRYGNGRAAPIVTGYVGTSVTSRDR